MKRGSMIDGDRRASVSLGKCASKKKGKKKGEITMLVFVFEGRDLKGRVRWARVQFDLHACVNKCERGC